jgi:catechol 2,3-dioxygenase-like lactoylglutathione lyase family enzyme
VENVLGIHHVSVIVAETGRALRFYRDTLGLDVLKEWGRSGMALT